MTAALPLSGRVAIVTGAGREDGRAIALALGAAGAAVVAVDLNPDAVQATADAITALGGSADAHTLDPAFKLAVQTMLYTVLEVRGRVDILVNAAAFEPRAEALRLDEAEWNRTLDVNLKAAFLAAQTVARALKAQREAAGSAAPAGLILNVLRPAAAAPAAVQAARAGLAALTEALAAEWAAHGVQVVALPAGPEAAAQAVALAQAVWP